MCRSGFVLAVSAVLAGAATGQEKKGDGFAKAPDSPATKKALAAYDAFPKADRAALVREWREEVARIKKAMADDEARLKTALTPRDRQKYAKYIADYQARLARREKNDPPYLTKERAKGYFDARVKQLGYDALTPTEKKLVDSYLASGRPPSMHVSDNDPLASYGVGSIGTLEFFGGLTVRQVAGPDQMLAAGRELPRSAPQDIWLEGVSTKGIADGEALSLGNTVLEMVGTKRYTTVTGAARTVRHFRAVDTTNVDRLVRDPELGRLHAQVKGD